MWADLPEAIEAEFYQPEPWVVLEHRLADRVRRGASTLALERKRQRAAAERCPKRSETAPCRGCGKTFDRRPRGWLRTFCDDRCRQLFHNRRIPKPKAPCVTCGGQVLSPRRRYCTDRCARIDAGVRERAARRRAA